MTDMTDNIYPLPIDKWVKYYWMDRVIKSIVSNFNITKLNENLM